MEKFSSYCKLFGVIALIGGPIMGVVSRDNYKERQVIEKEGKTVPALVTGGEFKKGRRSGTKRNLTVQFMPAGEKKPVQKTYDVPKEYWDTYVTNDSTLKREDAEVRYLPADPNRNFLVGSSSPKKETEYIFYGVGGVGLLLAAFGFTRRG